MNVRAKREGVEEVFARDRVLLVMQQALEQRYSPSSPAICNNSDPSEAVKPDQIQSATRVSSTTRSTSTDVSKQRLHISLHYTLRRHSRTERLLLDAHASCSSRNDNSGSPPLLNSLSAWCEEGTCVAHAVVAECLRHLSFLSLMQVDLRALCGLPDTSGARARRRGDAADPSAAASPLTSWHTFFELPPRWVMQSLAAVDRHTFVGDAAWQVRRSVTPLDVGAVVVKRDDPALVTSRAAASVEIEESRPSLSAVRRYRVVAAAPMTRGAYWVDVTPIDALPTAAKCVERVDRKALWLSPPVPLHVDALLPCDELSSERGVSTGIYVFFLRALQQQQQRRAKRTGKEAVGGSNRLLSTLGSSSNTGNEASDMPSMAADLSFRLTRCAQQRRAELANRIQRLSLGVSTSAAVMGKGVGEGQASVSPAVSVLLQVRVDVVRGCLQLRARVLGGTPPDGSPSPAWDDVAGTSGRCKRRREGETTDGTLSDVDSSDMGTDAERRVQGQHQAGVASPVVEVLLRSARKLAALYDMTRASLLAQRQRGEEEQNDAQCSHRPNAGCGLAADSDIPQKSVGAPRFLPVASDALENLTRRAEVEAEASAALCTWHNVVLGEDEVILSEGQSSVEAIAGRAEKSFFARLFTLLLRYRSLFGEQGYNQGPQAAVPPPIMEELARIFHICAEAFASPLNAHLPQFGSLFPDTDAYFGSMGSFFDLVLGGGDGSSEGRMHDGGAATLHLFDECHVEVNPPFDTALLQCMEEHLLACLKRAEKSTHSLLFLIVLPSHDLDASEVRAAHVSATAISAPSHAARLAKTTAADTSNSTTNAPSAFSSEAGPASTDRSLRESSYCLAHVLCDAAESVYVDGHQHLLESPFFCIGTPTRLILLGNGAARERFSSAAAQLNEVRLSWKKLTESAMLR
ncbi:hypothetical protein ABL78_5113 [Leptomonas seymouri]|uniref:PCIF1 WW domain-containing protein n=1 Tax=Leptomonas seymouri TaxID=5684 RepID=A0A0N1HXB7_LEPSE|nr:hypothetical protein ABL78_5113 [Leptomonas seymouri]|eukprot:KPI85832.1 hypothetical protein ABL78_5113 [Leptomonas seymouri]